METSKIFLMGMLVLMLFMVVPAMAITFPITFTGDAVADFPPGPGVLIITDPGNVPPPPEIYEIPAGVNRSGWDIEDLRLAYDSDTDTMYVAVNSFGVVGDGDGDGDPSSSSSTYVDLENLSGPEGVCVYFDLDMQPVDFDNKTSWDVIIGVDGGHSVTSGFAVTKWLFNNQFFPPGNFDFMLELTSGHAGIFPENPRGVLVPKQGGPYPSGPWPDFEFTITDFSHLQEDAEFGPDLVPGLFRVGAFMGSGGDGGIGEDYVYYHQIPSTTVTITPTPSSTTPGSTVILEVTETNNSEAVVGQIYGTGTPEFPDPPYDTMPYSFFPVEVDVAQQQADTTWKTIATLSGITADDESMTKDGILQGGETMTWNDIPSEPVTLDPTNFRARASGTDPIGFIHTYEEDQDEEATAFVMILSTDVDIKANGSDGPIDLSGAEDVTLTITENNDGSTDLLNPYIEVYKKDPADPLPGTLIGTFYKTSSPEYQGGDGDSDGELDGIVSVPTNGETWEWQVIVSGADVTTTTEFVVIGYGTDPVLNWPVTWCAEITIPEIFCDQDEIDLVTVNPPQNPTTDIDIEANGSVGPITIGVGEPVTLTICEKNDGDIPLSNVEVDVYYDYVADGIGGTGDEIFLTTLNRNSTGWSELPGGNGDNILDQGETWCWDYVVSAVNEDTIFIAYGYGEYIVDGEVIMIVTYCTTSGEPEVICDEDERDDVRVNTESFGCRLTAGGNSDAEYVDESDADASAASLGGDRIRFGGQAGANTALPPQPKGEWTHSQQKGPHGSFTFHAGTASAPLGTEIIEIVCSDPPGCKPSGDPPSPCKQVDFDGIGTFKNFGKEGTAREPQWDIPGANAECSSKGGKWRFDGTFHYFQVNADDNGEPGNQIKNLANTGTCPPDGFGLNGSIELANCDCPDFYRITIYKGKKAAEVEWDDTHTNILLSSLNTTEVIYEFYGYLDGGNMQTHHLTGYDRQAYNDLDNTVNLNLLAANWLEGF